MYIKEGFGGSDLCFGETFEQLISRNNFQQNSILLVLLPCFPIKTEKQTYVLNVSLFKKFWFSETVSKNCDPARKRTTGFEQL